MKQKIGTHNCKEGPKYSDSFSINEYEIPLPHQIGKAKKMIHKHHNKSDALNYTCCISIKKRYLSLTVCHKVNRLSFLNSKN